MKKCIESGITFYPDAVRPTVFNPVVLSKVEIPIKGTGAYEQLVITGRPLFANSLLKKTEEAMYDLSSDINLSRQDIPNYRLEALIDDRGKETYYAEIELPRGLELTDKAKAFRSFAKLPKTKCNITPNGIYLDLDGQAMSLLSEVANDEYLTLEETEGRVKFDLDTLMAYRTHIQGQPLKGQPPYFFEFIISQPWQEASPFFVSLRVDLGTNDFSVVNAEIEQLLNEERLTVEHLKNLADYRIIIELSEERQERIKAENAKIAGEAK